jgi:hypothetical protein
MFAAIHNVGNKSKAGNEKFFSHPQSKSTEAQQKSGGELQATMHLSRKPACICCPSTLLSAQPGS